jgi:hypothetical protein
MANRSQRRGLAFGSAPAVMKLGYLNVAPMACARPGHLCLAERGATDRQLMAMFGWESEKEATKYTKAANRKRLAAAAMRLEDQNENSNCPAELSHREKA